VKFGQLVYELRIRQRLTLREFCRMTELDPGYWSRIERGLHHPPKSKQVLNNIAKALKLKENSEDWHTLFELATISFIPAELLANPSIVDMLPALFRTVRGDRPDKQDLERLIEMLREA